MSTIRLYKQNCDTYEREVLGKITEQQLDFLMDNLEEEFDEDEEYFLSADTLEYLKEQGADGDLISMLNSALEGCRDGVDIFYLIE
jgi:processive 1,2-diacylglycerol beta-glucosyltransferase